VVSKTEEALKNFTTKLCRIAEGPEGLKWELEFAFLEAGNGTLYQLGQGFISIWGNTGWDCGI